MNRIEKFLAALDPERRAQVELLVARILAGDLEHLDLRKLKGRSDEFRVRVGRIRIQFTYNGREYRILTIGWRNEKTY